MQKLCLVGTEKDTDDFFAGYLQRRGKIAIPMQRAESYFNVRYFICEDISEIDDHNTRVLYITTEPNYKEDNDYLCAEFVCSRHSLSMCVVKLIDNDKLQESVEESNETVPTFSIPRVPTLKRNEVKTQLVVGKSSHFGLYRLHLFLTCDNKPFVEGIKKSVSEFNSRISGAVEGRDGFDITLRKRVAEWINGTVKELPVALINTFLQTSMAYNTEDPLCLMLWESIPVDKLAEGTQQRQTAMKFIFLVLENNPNSLVYNICKHNNIPVGALSAMHIKKYLIDKEIFPLI